jgi:hypothetical protein
MWITVGIIVFFFVLITATAIWEKRLIWPYGEPEPQPRYPDPAAYGYNIVAQAVQNGFHCFGWSPHLGGSRYLVSYGMLISPDRLYLATVGTGTIFGLPANSTCLYSRGTNGRLYFSTNHQSGAELDVCALQKCQLVPGAEFADLWRRHCEWLQADSIKIEPFDVGSEFGCLHRLRIVRFEEMHRLGVIRYIDSEKTRWSYTPTGAVRVSALNYFVGMVRAVTFGRFPRSV